MIFPVRIYFDDFGNHPPRWIIGQLRRVADEFGRPGIEGKRGQSNARVRRNGYLRIEWPSRRLAKQFQAAVDELWGHLVSTKRFRRT